MGNTAFYAHETVCGSATSLGARAGCRSIDVSLYHLAPLRPGIDSLRKNQSSGRLAAHSPARAVWSAEPADAH